MNLNRPKPIAIFTLLMFVCGTHCVAVPNSNSVSKSEVKQPSNSAQKAEKVQNSDSKGSKTAADKSTTQDKDEEDKSTIHALASEYAVHMKKATAALHIKGDLTQVEERRLWADYKAGKYSKNKVFMSNMAKAEPYHDKMRSILHIFENQRPKRLIFSHPANPAGNQNISK